ncbi:MAG: hypothetical protein M1470_02985 [Bacteroidetes bacterium]|nr:hypothetical protein [Bacteroidota bacterium]MCL5739225.1 hypothetical protein [Bacteroidota bacterium]
MKNLQARLERIEQQIGMNSTQKVIVDDIGYDGMDAIPTVEVSAIAHQLAARRRFPVCIVHGSDILQAWEGDR